jgi:hypothetical protein
MSIAPWWRHQAAAIFRLAHEREHVAGRIETPAATQVFALPQGEHGQRADSPNRQRPPIGGHRSAPADRLEVQAEAREQPGAQRRIRRFVAQQQVRGGPVRPRTIIPCFAICSAHPIALDLAPHADSRIV